MKNAIGTDKSSFLKIMSDVLEMNLNSEDLPKSMEELEIDSMQFLRLIVIFEHIFNLEFENNMLLLSKFDNLNNFIDYINARRADFDRANKMNRLNYGKLI